MPALSEGTFPLSSRSPRVSKILPITLWDISSANGRKWPGAILDLSDHGLRISTGTTLRQGQIVRVVVNDTGLCFKRCRVVWTRKVHPSQLDQSGLEVLR